MSAANVQQHSEQRGGVTMRLHGLDISYYTGKVQACLRAKGLPHELIEMDTRDFRRCAAQTGVAQMPQLELGNGCWLTDSSAIVEHFEQACPEPALYPAQGALCFIAHLLEDFADEWLWRPAMYYRWAFDEDASLVSERLARGLLRDVPLPVALRRLYIRARQRRLFLRGDGVTPATAPVLQAVYHDTLEALQGALATRPFLLGQRPSQADLGFFGPMFRHFSADPTPARLLRERAPAVLEWLDRMWTLHPAVFENSPQPETLAEGLSPLLVMVCDDYLPTLASQEGGLKQGARKVTWHCRGVAFTVPVNPYQVHCLQQLRRRYQALKDAQRQQVNAWLMTCGATRAQAALDLLAQPALLQGTAPGRRKPLDRQWNPT
jgi:glutathione S-transferase